MNVDGGIQISEIGAIARRRGKAIAATALGVLLVIYWISMALPNTYTSYATVLVEPQAVDPELVSAGVADSDLNQRLHLMTAQILSRGRLSRIIDEEELYQEESEYMLREEIIDLMREAVRVEPVIPEITQGLGFQAAPSEISEFKISYDNYDAVVAMEVAQKLANDFISTHIDARVQTSQKSLDFIEGELTRLAERVRRVEGDIARVKNENPGKLPEDFDANQRRLDRVLQNLTITQQRLAEATSDEAFYKSQLGLARAVGGGGDAASPARRLQVLELELREFESRGFTQKHPDVISKREEIALLEDQIANGESESVALSPIAQQTEAQARRSSLQRVAAEAEIQRLQGDADEIRTLIEATPAVAEQLDALSLDYEHLSVTIQDFANRHNEATVQAQLERRQLGEQFRVLEAAFEAPEPSAPNRILILVLGLVFSCMVGVGVGVLLEATDTSPHSPRQLQDRLQLPVLAAIPEIWLESDRVRARRERFRTTMVTAGLVVFALVGGAGTYLWVNGVPRFLSFGGSETEQSAPAPSARVTGSSES
ncbi:MAG: hypothetical protein AAF430_23405 [Myxococcota bacterium]